MQPRDSIRGFAIGGYFMRLPVAVHLQAMFEHPQLRIGQGQGFGLLHTDRPRRR